MGGGGGGGVGGVGGPGPANILIIEKIDCSLGPGAMEYPWARTGSRRPCIQEKQNRTILKVGPSDTSDKKLTYLLL